MSSLNRILVTGGSGFIGTNAIDYLLSRGYVVCSTDIAPPSRKEHEAVFSRCDLLDGIGLRNLFLRFNPDFLLHLGARTDTFERKSLDGYAANMQGVKNVIAAANACRSLRRLVMTSSRLVCRIEYMPKSDDDFCPPNFYGQSKVESEKIVKGSEIGPEWVITRPTAIWGPGFLVPSYRDFFEQIRRGTYFHLGRANPLKTFGYVKNSVYQMERLLLAPREKVDRQLYYIGDYEPVSLRDWADSIALEFGRQPNPTLPLSALRLAARVGDILKAIGWKTVPLTSYRLNNMLSPAVFDGSRLRELTGPLPYDLRSATRETVQWLKANP